MQCRMAAILFVVNGLNNALGFVSLACKHPRQLNLPGMEETHGSTSNSTR